MNYGRLVLAAVAATVVDAVYGLTVWAKVLHGEFARYPQIYRAGDEPSGLALMFRGFIDALNNWYIRRSRDRVWAKGMTDDKRDCYDTLWTVLTTVCRLAAPLLPMITERVYRGRKKLDYFGTASVRQIRDRRT